MKKMFLTMGAAALALVGAVSCSSKSSVKDAEDEGALLKARIENCTDTDSLRIYVEQAREYAWKLESEGKGAEAKAYLDEVAPVVEKKDPAVVSYFEELKEKAKEDFEEAKDAVGDAADATKDKTQELVDSVKSKGAAAVDAVKDKGEAAVDVTKKKTEAAVEKGKEKVSDAAQKGADKVKDLLK